MHGVNEARVKLWIEALRSGEYRQCQSVLEQENGDGSVSHCCLGVAQRVALHHGYNDGDDPGMDWGAESMDNDVANNWYGFSDEVGGGDPELGRFPDDGGIEYNSSCVQANDDKDWSFEQIADALEKRYITPPNIEREA